ncbi:unnamed protein product [Adineta ricciae]|uniref:Voltage-gated hydrogen channel 1 n=1 Tax=Adineta ricciae TaxID=249248 RepID=A0A815EWD7_ADIRI|nr:unnamed protein product [Adineta ricciae]CAF1315364.1 unnamed protein product [Adineta ricciae]
MPNAIVGDADLAVQGTKEVELSENTSQPISLHENGSVTVPLFTKTSTTSLTDHPEVNNKGCCVIVHRWWNVDYRCQHQIIEFVERPIFHMFIIMFVLIDCFLVIGELMFDFFKLREPCHSKNSHHEHHHQFEMIAEILHYSSLILLGMFLLEVVVKIYAFGRQWWNFHNKKMEWLDAIIVIVSFAVDLLLLHKTSMIAEISLLFISIRLWRFIRIVNSVAQSVRSQDETRREHLAATYIQMIELLLKISEQKTNTMSEFCNDFEFESRIQNYIQIDQQCHLMIEHCSKPSSLNTIHDMIHRLQNAIDQME